MKKMIAVIVSGVLAVVVAVACIMCLERIGVGNVGVVYNAGGVKDATLYAGWHWMSPFDSVKQFPISQQQIVFSNSPEDYNAKEHPDWSIDAPANGGMVKLNLTVNYSFNPGQVVEFYKRFNGMDGNALVENYIQNSIIAYVKEVTPQFSVMDIYSDKRLQEKIKAKEQAKQDAEIAELEKQTAAAQAEVAKTKAQAEADVKVIEAQAEAEANKILSESITPELIQMTEAEARKEHGWVTVQGADVVAVE